ncbi:hypothetical protein [Tsukamurella sp. NPDC003166]|uniref:hypothetical protein n=1 Tax=Tsukamurella sp. NPDC003166 TaxID=3154444 RepID=UPI0033B5A731
MTRWHPWREARRRAHLDITFDAPTTVRGRHAADGRVQLHPRMTQAERRCALAHELVHDERGVRPVEPVLSAMEEHLVEAIAARRLVQLDQLVDVLRWTRHTSEVADELWVDVPMLLALTRSLTARERAWIDEQLEEQPC